MWTHRAHSCDKCEKSFQHGIELENHKQQHSGIFCKSCGKYYKVQNDLKKHQAKLYQPKIPCYIFMWQIIFQNKWSFEAYSKAQNSSYSCDQCEKSFKLEKYQQRHMRLICDNCGKHFKAANVLKQHQAIHTGEKLFQCKVCTNHSPRVENFLGAKSFELEVELNIHQQEFICQSCGKHFRIPTDLKKHQVIHSGKQHFSCNRCGKSYSGDSSLKIHYRVHTGEKPYTCNHCEKSFGGLWHLKLHERVRTGEKPCIYCNTSFS